MSDPTARRGPVVYRSAKVGGALLGAASVQFVVSMAIVQLHYPGYSDLGNAVSDLGGPGSPWAWLFNDSVRALGVLGIPGVLLVRSALRPKLSRQAGIGAFLVGLVGAVLVGTYPEGSPELNGGIHGLVAGITFLFAGLTLVLLSFAMLRDTRWDGIRAYTGASGLVTLVATGLYASNIFLGIGPGGMERLIIGPPLLWALVVAIHLGRLTTFSASSPRRDPDSGLGA